MTNILIQIVELINPNYILVNYMIRIMIEPLVLAHVIRLV